MKRRILFVGIVVFIACEDDPRYVYTAQRYDPTLGCLDDHTSIERVPGESVTVTCKPACLTVGTDLFVSTVCPPLPPSAAEVEESTPECQAALDASRLAASCTAEEEESDGGGEEDGGGEADGGGGEDAGEDAPIEEDAQVDSGIKDAGDGG